MSAGEQWRLLSAEETAGAHRAILPSTQSDAASLNFSDILT